MNREAFDELVGLDSSDLTPDEVLHYRPSFCELLAEALPPPAFVKAHDAYLRLPGGATLFPKAATTGVIHLVRNPLDVAVSCAHHRNRSIDDKVDGCSGSQLTPHFKLWYGAYLDCIADAHLRNRHEGWTGSGP